MAKLILSWNLKSEDTSKYFEFVVQNYLPELSKFNMRPSQAWYTLYGAGPQIVTTIETPDGDYESMLKIVRSPAWANLRAMLDEFVTDYRQHIAH